MPKKPFFPCEIMPDDPGEARLLGLYPQRQENHWMQRIKITGGQLTAQQWRALSEITNKYTPKTPLHLTTRQCLEFHSLTNDIIPDVQKTLNSSDLTGLGACGDTLRNVTVCPCSGVISQSLDLYPLANQLKNQLESLNEIYTLPRKFKISLSCCQSANGQPWINDLGFIARKKDGQWGFAVTIAGSLGARPQTAIWLTDWIEPDDVLLVALAAIQVFNEHGDRDNRRKARLRHVRERLGNDKFLSLINERIEQIKQQQTFPAILLTETINGLDSEAILTFPNGDISPSEAAALAELTSNDNLAVRISINHRIIVFGPDSTTIQNAIANQPALQSPDAPQPTIVACPGNRWCKHGITDTNKMADMIRHKYAATLNSETIICISGCPNGCSQHAVAPIGLSGGLTTIDGKKQEAYNFLTGGDMGKTDKLSEVVATKLTVEQVLEKIGSTITNT